MGSATDLNGSKKGAESLPPRVAGVDGDKLKSFIERIQSLEAEVRDLNGDKADLYGEAEEAGLDKKALKAVVAWLRKSPAERDAEDFILDQYKLALGVEPRGEPPTVIKVDDLPDPPAHVHARGNGHAPRHQEAYDAGRADGLANHNDNSHRWPSGEPGHGDYWIGHQDGCAARIDGAEADMLPPAAARARARGRAR